MFIQTDVDDCKHEDLRLRRRVVKSGAIQYVMQCQRCGDSMNQPISHARVMAMGKGTPPDFDEALKVTYQDEWRKRHAQRQTGFFQQYNEYLRSPEWAHRRRLVLERAAGLCEGCREKSATQVHHLTYRNVGNELLFELVALCDGCHDRVHDGR